MIKNMSIENLVELTVVIRSYRESDGLSSWYRVKNEIIGNFTETACANYNSHHFCYDESCENCWRREKSKVRNDINALFSGVAT